MVLYMIGLGLSDEKDITVKGLEAVKNAKSVYLEKYTAILMITKEKLEEFYGREVIEADREFVESGSEDMINEANGEANDEGDGRQGDQADLGVLLVYLGRHGCFELIIFDAMMFGRLLGKIMRG